MFLATGHVSALGHLSQPNLTWVLFRHLSTKAILAGDQCPLSTVLEIPVACSLCLCSERCPGCIQVRAGVMAGGARGTQKQRACLPGSLLVPWCRKPQSKWWEHFFGRLRPMLSYVLAKLGQVRDHHHSLGCGWREPYAAQQMLLGPKKGA